VVATGEDIGCRSLTGGVFGGACALRPAIRRVGREWGRQGGRERKNGVGGCVVSWEGGKNRRDARLRDW
jgi:hypothetical protein